MAIGFQNSYRAFDLIDEEPALSAMHFALSAAWILIVARRITRKKESE